MGHTLVLNANYTPISIHPLSTMPWWKAIQKIFEDKVDVMVSYSNWVARSPSLTMNVPAIVRAKQYVNVERFTCIDDDTIKMRDNYTCQYCLRKFAKEDLTMDHVIPASHGGLRRADNLVASCAPCNQRRGNDTSIQPHRQPWRPTRYELVAMLRQYPKTVPHPSWIPYIGWDESLVKIGQPTGEPGYTWLDDPMELPAIDDPTYIAL